MIYEDLAVSAELANPAASLGQIIISPAKQVSDLKSLEREEALQLFWTASFAATAVFETLGAQGSNIVLRDGAGVELDVFARNADDSLSVGWTPSPGDRAEIAEVAKKVSDAFWYVGKQDSSEEKEPVEQEPEPKPVVESEDMRVKHLQRRF